LDSGTKGGTIQRSFCEYEHDRSNGYSQIVECKELTEQTNMLSAVTRREMTTMSLMVHAHLTIVNYVQTGGMDMKRRQEYH
jgi:hypothetical protein